MPVIDCHVHLGVEMGAYLRGEYPYAQHGHDLVKTGAACGITHYVVFPMVSYLGLNLSALRENRIENRDALEQVPYAWENRRVMEECRLFAEDGKHFLPFAMFDPSRQVPAQIAALRELRCDYKIWGLKTQPTMIQSPIRSLLDVGQGFLELAAEWDVPLLIHSSVLPADIWSQASDILDIAEQWPGVRFNIAHSCRFDRPCLDRLAALPNCWFDISAHGIHCQLAFKDSPIVAPAERRFTSDYARPEVVLYDLASAYPGKVLWGSDAPYYSFAAPVEDETLALLSSYEAEASYLNALPGHMKQQISWDNILAWMGAQLDAN